MVNHIFHSIKHIKYVVIQQNIILFNLNIINQMIYNYYNVNNVLVLKGFGVVNSNEKLIYF